MTSYSQTNSGAVTINGDGSGNPVVFNFAYGSNVNLGGQIVLTGGLTPDDVIWNFTSSGKQVQLNNNGGTFQGVILAPNDQYQSDSSNLIGRVWGGSAGNMEIVSGANVTAPPMTGTLTNTATACAANAACVQSTAGILINPVGPGTPPSGPAVCRGDTATIGYWNNKNGQALIEEMNGGSSSTALANWLATNFPYLYGADSSNNLTGKTNADVAALFQTFFGGGAPKTSAQVMAGALAAYVTDSNLAGTNIAGGQGFNISTTGSGAKTYNVSSDGTGAGLLNSTSYTVLVLLQQANLETELGTFNATSFNDIFSNINQTGDISGGTNAGPLSVTCPATTMGPLGVAFNSGPMTVTGGTAPYVYSIVGTLPSGLTLNTSTGAVTGTPTVAGTFSIEVTDANGTTGTTCDLAIGAGYTLTVNPSSVTVVAGQAATTIFTFTPVGGFVGTVSFACSGLPVGATCTFAPPSVTANGSNTVQTSILTITTTASGTATVAQNKVTSGGHSGVTLLPAGPVAWQLHRLAAPVVHG